MSKNLIIEISNCTTEQYFAIYTDGTLVGFGKPKDECIFNNYVKLPNKLVHSISLSDPVFAKMSLSRLTKDWIKDKKASEVDFILWFQVINKTTGQNFLFYQCGTILGFGSPEDSYRIVNYYTSNKFFE